MSVGEKALPSRREDGEEQGHKNNKEKVVCYGRCFSGIELSLGPGPLKDMDPAKLKREIRLWAKAVVNYARQLSFSSSPRSSSSSSPPMSRGREHGCKTTSPRGSHGGAPPL